ncbi:MAG: transposase, partial [Methanosarcinales archaeon]
MVARTISAAKLAEQLKGYSSYVVRRQCWNDVSKKLWGDHFWSDG